MKQISLRDYKIFSLWLPVIVPVICCLIYNNFGIINILVFFLYFFPYTLFLLSSLIKMRKTDVTELNLFTKKAPADFTKFYFFYIFLLSCILAINLLNLKAFAVFIFGPFALVSVILVSYGYLLLANILENILYKIGIISK